MPIKPGEIIPVFISFLYLIAAQCRMAFSSSEKILNSLRMPALPSKSFFLFPLKGMRATRVTSLVEAIDRRLGWKPSCLRRALALSSLLRGLGLSPEFKIGANAQNEIFKAHCWLELGGQKLEMRAPDDSYTVLS